MSAEPNGLKGCPHCDSKVFAKQGHGDITYFICTTCGTVASFAPHKKGREAFEAFNRRTPDAAQAERIAQLEQKLAEWQQMYREIRASHESLWRQRDTAQAELKAARGEAVAWFYPQYQNGSRGKNFLYVKYDSPRTDGNGNILPGQFCASSHARTQGGETGS